MKQNSTRLGSIAVMLLIFSGVANAQLHDFMLWINDMPAVEGQICDDWGYEFGRQISQENHVELLGVDCVQTTMTRGWDIRITYRAEERIFVTSTENTSSGLAPMALYGNGEACEEDLGNQVDIFRTETGLEPVLAYCFSNKYSSDDAGIVIKAFGPARKQPMLVGINLYGTVANHNADSFFEMWSDWFAQRDAKLARSFGENRLAYINMGLLVYAAERIRLTDKIVGKVSSKELCLGAETELKAALSQSSPQAAVTYCTMPNGPQRDFELNIVTESGEELRVFKRAEFFETEELCLQKKDALTELYRNRGRDILVSVCSRQISRQYQFSTLERLN
jgi:hypothetical protein